MFGKRASHKARSEGDARAALKAALDQLGRSRNVPVGEFPHCVEVLRDLRDEADRWLILFVRDAIERGHTWTDVGEMLGVTRQAAHEKYAPRIVALAKQDIEQGPERDRPVVRRLH